MAIINAGLSTEYKKSQDFMVSNVRSVLLTISKYVREKTDAIPVQIYEEVTAFEKI